MKNITGRSILRGNYEYCSLSDEYLETEDMIRKNSQAMKDAYKKAN